MLQTKKLQLILKTNYLIESINALDYCLSKARTPSSTLFKSNNLRHVCEKDYS